MSTPTAPNLEKVVVLYNRSPHTQHVRIFRDREACLKWIDRLAASNVTSSIFYDLDQETVKLGNLIDWTAATMEGQGYSANRDEKTITRFVSNDGHRVVTIEWFYTMIFTQDRICHPTSIELWYIKEVPFGESVW